MINDSEYKKIIEEKDKQIAELCLKVDKLLKRVEELEIENQKLKDIIAKNSSNSSKPPSSDPYNKPKSLRRKSGKSSGGQKGHIGNCLKPVEVPDVVVDHQCETCACGCSLKGVPVLGFEKRQVFDIPPINLEVTEYRAEIKKCPNCDLQVKAVFPEAVNAPVQYGENIKAFASYLMNYQLIPFNRTSECLCDLFGAQVSEGWLHNVREKFSKDVKTTEDIIKNMLQAAKIVHFDETGISLQGEKKWLHSASTPFLTLLTAHEKRGSEAMDCIGILPNFTGTAVHDHWKPYFKYDLCRHAACNAHILRELDFFTGQYKQKWSEQISALLLEAKNLKEVTIEEGKSEFSDSFLAILSDSYNKITDSGFTEALKTFPIEIGKSGKKKKTKAENLLERLVKFKANILLFAYDFAVPFDNNQAERDIRMEKVRQKISGTVRGINSEKSIFRIRSYISTVRKNGQNVLQGIRDALKGNPFIPSRIS